MHALTCTMVGKQKELNYITNVELLKQLTFEVELND